MIYSIKSAENMIVSYVIHLESFTLVNKNV